MDFDFVSGIEKSYRIFQGEFEIGFLVENLGKISEIIL